METQKCKYLENEERFLNEINSVSLNYLRAIIWCENEKLWSQTVIFGK